MDVFCVMQLMQRILFRPKFSMLAFVLWATNLLFVNPYSKKKIQSCCSYTWAANNYEFIARKFVQQSYEFTVCEFVQKFYEFVVRELAYCDLANLQFVSSYSNFRNLCGRPESTEETDGLCTNREANWAVASSHFSIRTRWWLSKNIMNALKQSAACRAQARPSEQSFARMWLAMCGLSMLSILQ